MTWVAELINESAGKRGDNHTMAFMWLLRSPFINEVDFDSAHFRLLFERENDAGALESTLLQRVCLYSPHLLGRGLWFITELFRGLDGMRLRESNVACHLASTRCIYRIDFASDDV